MTGHSGQRMAACRCPMLRDRRMVVLGLVVTLGVLFLLLTRAWEVHIQACVNEKKISQNILDDILSPKETNRDLSVNEEKISEDIPDDVLSPNETHRDLRLLRQFWRRQLPDPSVIESMSLLEVRHLYHSYLDNVEVVCRRILRFGNLGDGGWEICDDREFRPGRPCVVYSFGINDDFSFDDAVSRMYECHVYSFDPSMKKESHNRSSTVTFFNMGLGGEGGSVLFRNKPPAGWIVKTLSDIRAMLGHTDVAPDIVKMDIEQSEWPALDHGLQHGALRGVRQLLVEFHNELGPPADYDRFMLTVLSRLQAAGFRRFLSHKNPVLNLKDPMIQSWSRPCCYEVYFVNSNFSRN